MTDLDIIIITWQSIKQLEGDALALPTASLIDKTITALEELKKLKGEEE